MRNKPKNHATTGCFLDEMSFAGDAMSPQLAARKYVADRLGGESRQNQLQHLKQLLAENEALKRTTEANLLALTEVRCFYFL
jgi:hypothetical protein